MLSALKELLKYESVEPDVFDLEDAPLDEVTVADGDDSILAESQPGEDK